jgi:vacuolar-type H+-ATPase subunit I/STV1
LLTECCHLQNAIEQRQNRNLNEKEETTLTKQLIRENRIAIANLHYQLKHDINRNSKKKEYFRWIDGFEKEIRSTEEENDKMEEQYKQIMAVIETTRKKTNAVELRINQTQQELLHI